MAHVAIVGAGPVGLEAALAADAAGHRVTVFEQAPHVAGNVRDWAHVRLFTPWSMNLLPHAPDPSLDADACPTGAEFAAYLERAAALLPEGSLRLATTVQAVARDRLLKSDEIGTTVRAGRPFRLLVRDAAGRESVETADAVLDTSGTWHHPAALGHGGIPALGEGDVPVVRRIPEVDASWAGRRVLLVGAGKSAQTAARALDGAGADLTWAVRSTAPTWGAVEDDVLPDRAALVASSEQLRAAGRVVTGVVVEALRRDGDTVVTTLADEDGGTREVVADVVVALVGGTPDASIYRQLQVHECYASEGVMNLAATLLGGSGDCLAQVSPGIDALRNPEPRFFVLGSKSYGRTSTFLLRVGYEQVEAVLTALDAELPVAA